MAKIKFGGNWKHKKIPDLKGENGNLHTCSGGNQGGDNLGTMKSGDEKGAENRD